MMASIRTGISDNQFIDLGVTPTQTGNTTFTLAGNQMQWYPYGNRVKANVGGTLMYGTVISSTFTTNTGVTLRMDLGDAAVLTASLSAMSTGFPSAVNGALPEVVYRDRNYFHNPYMDIWQRGNGPFSFSSVSVNRCCPDRWGTTFVIASAGPTISITRAERSANASNVPTLAQCGVLLNSSVCISVGAALSGVSASDVVVFGQAIEGYNFRNMAQKPMALSFWVNSTTTGTYCMSVYNGTDRSYVQPFSISSASTWEKKTFVIPESPSAGTWDYSSGAGLTVRVALVAGTSSQTTNSGQWTAVGAVATAAQLNFMAATGRAIKFAAWSIREGNQEIPLESIDARVDLANCERYLKVYGSGCAFHGLNVTTTEVRPVITMPVTMRAFPSLSATSNAANLMITGGGFVSCSAITLLNSSLNTMLLRFMPVSTVSAGDSSVMLMSTGAQIVIKAEI